MLYFDIESDDLLYAATKIHCIVAYDDEKDLYHIYATGDYTYPVNSQCYTNIEDMLYVLNTAPALCSFNGIGFDLPLLKKLHGFEYSLDNQIDCLLLSRLYYPDRAGHSLEYFGQLLGFPKGSHSDWSCFSQEMLDYCIQDVLVLRKVHHYLQHEAGNWDWSESIRLEKKIQSIQTQQELKGVLFDVKAAVALSATIEAELAPLEEKIMQGIPSKAVQVGVTVDKPFKKNGKLTKNVEDWLKGECNG